MLSDQYIVDFTALRDGNHEYCFKLDDAFFESPDKIELRGVQLEVLMLLMKQASTIDLSFKIKGSVELECDRCLEKYNGLIEGEHYAHIQLGGSIEDQDEDIILLGAQESSFDAEPLIYDFVILSLPMRRVHPEDANGNNGCDPLMFAKLNSHLIDNAADTDIADTELN